MTKQSFFDLLAIELGIANNNMTETTDLESLEGWDSWNILVVMKFVDDSFKVNLTADDFKEMKTIGNLMDKIGKQKFE